jgi:CDP-diacylglycerol--glycerol-3-phosphate 3-phosphatidyltransferase
MTRRAAEQPATPALSISGVLGLIGRTILGVIVGVLSALRIHPNVLTLTGLAINIFAAVLFGKGMFTWAGLVVLFAGVFDMVDGEVARRTNRVTKFGAFFDSVIDRYSDMVLLLGLVVWYAKLDRDFYAGLVVMSLIGSIMTSYTRARAESLIPACKVGFLERPERIVLLIIGCLSNRMGAAMWAMAILSNWTVVARICYTWKESKRLEGA